MDVEEIGWLKIGREKWTGFKNKQNFIPFTQSTTHIRTHCRGGLLFTPTWRVSARHVYAVFHKNLFERFQMFRQTDLLYQATATANAEHCEILKIKPGCIGTKRLSRFAFGRDLTVDGLISFLDVGNTWKSHLRVTKQQNHVHKSVS